MAIADVAALLACVGMLLCLWGLVEVRRFARPGSADVRSEAAGTSRYYPPVSILKPLCGDEPLLYEAIESAFCQAYPDFQIVFGIQDSADPAVAVVERLRSRFPERDIQVVIDSTLHGPNRKVSNLINMLPFARHDILVISDSDLHLPANYLDDLVGALEKPGTGLVTSLYIGVPAGPSVWAASLGATQISHYFLPGVLMSRAMGRQDCLGSTAMFRRETLSRVGGFQALVQLLAEDNVLGQRVRELGLSIQLAGIVPAATVPEPSLGPLWRHEMRWTRTIRELTPWSLCASTVQYPLFWAVVAVALSGAAPWALALFFLSWAVRTACVRDIDRSLKPLVGRPSLPTPVWLLPPRDVMSVLQIAACFWVNEVTWRGHKMGVGTDPTIRNDNLAAPFEPESLLPEN